jgi:small subunit ribosomal protein S3
MGHKVHPTVFRLGPQYTWKSRWFATGKRYAELVNTDIKLRNELMKKLANAGICEVEIERSLRSITIRLFVSRPGVVIGRGGSGIEELRKFIYVFLKINPDDSHAVRVDVPVEEVKSPDLNAYLVAKRVADQLQRRIPHRRVVHRSLDTVMAAGAKGVKIILGGRIAGAEISRTEKYFQGSIPQQTIRADIDYAEVPCLTRSGYVGIKVYIYKGGAQLS